MLFSNVKWAHLVVILIMFLIVKAFVVSHYGQGLYCLCYLITNMRGMRFAYFIRSVCLAHVHENKRGLVA